MPLFSLRSKSSCGLGEYPDLLPIIDWCQKLGLDVLQLLPLNDGGLDTSPYCALSAFALNPLHLGLSSLPDLDKVPDAKDQLRKLQSLSQSQRIDYLQIRNAREHFLRSYYQIIHPLILDSPEFLEFTKQHQHWLSPYALFKALKIKLLWAPWEQWPEQLRKPNPKILEENQHEIDFQKTIQYLCFKQLREVKRRGEEKGVWIKGDIPILINRESADVWSNQDFFLLEYSAGAPPDLFAKEGQWWGFPIYNWDAIKKNDYAWWKKRLQIAENFYHIYRLDHIVGFFRIWAIPLGKPAKEGYFVPSEKEKWIPHGESIMRTMLDSCSMLPIGEDLGTVPPEVRLCLKHLGICGTKVMRWERNWDTDKSFIPFEQYPPESMTTVSTHDSDTLQLWWENDPEDAEEYARFKGWTYEKHLSASHRREILWDSHHSGSLFHINLLQEYLALIPEMTWPNPMDEKINFPGTVSDKNWSYRFRPYIEELTTHDHLAEVIRNVIS